MFLKLVTYFSFVKTGFGLGDNLSFVEQKKELII